MRWLPARSYCFRRSSSCSASSKEKKAKVHRSAGNTASGSAPETLPTTIQPKRLTSAPIKNEIAATESDQTFVELAREARSKLHRCE
jgi:hypothetical protein